MSARFGNLFLGQYKTLKKPSARYGIITPDSQGTVGNNMIMNFSAGAKVNNTIAAGAVSSPFWLTALEGVSDAAVFLLPIAGVLWFALQMYTHWKRYVRDRDDDETDSS